jgi:tRNA (guanine26-N2/guanine27-N2)-dimethyltransferase
MEEKIKLSMSKNVFYNPAMRLCRSISSLAVGAIGDEIEIVDAFCASGARGIRYARENPNVKALTFVDIEPEAIKLAKKNAKANKVKAAFKTGNISKVALEMVSDFVEIDPFGTPSPYLVDAFRFFNPKKTAYLSVTATDVAVLCGGKVAPCMKNYHSKPLNNEFTHETGLRIMLKRIAEVAAEFNMGIEPLVSFSNKHYLKSVIRLRRSADLAFESLQKLGYVSFEKETGFRTSGQFPESGMDYAGPLWLGEIHNAHILSQMKKLNDVRDYSDKDEISTMLGLMENEIGMPPYYYNIHAICKIRKLGRIPNMKEIIEKIKAGGHRAARTHFSHISIKTDAPYEAILEAV